MKKADEDFAAADYLLNGSDQSLAATACFHAQQCAEKYLKALLAFHSITFPKSHDLSELAASLPGSVALPLTPAELALLKRYAVETRYPGDWDPIGLGEAREALMLAAKVRDSVRAHLLGT